MNQDWSEQSFGSVYGNSRMCRPGGLPSFRLEPGG